MRILITALLALALTNAFAQITIDNTTYSTTQLVNGILIPAGSGTTVSNVQFSGVYNNSNRYQIGHFSTAGTTLGAMGISSGLVLSSGNTANIPLTLGTNPGAAAQMSTGYTSCTVGEIRESGTCPTIINDVNVLAGSNNYFNAAILEFDFVPVSTFVEFKYMFGSEEYKDNGGFINYQCSSYNDKFGFLISGPGIVGGAGYDNNAVNIARLANGSEVGINSVNDGVVGSSGGGPNAANCLSANPSWVQNVSTAEFLGTIDGTQLNGNTVVLTASRSGLTPGQTYHIRLIVTDVNDAAYDAVVYLEAGSFTTQAPCTPPANPTASVSTQPNCTTPTGTITVTAPTGPNIQYSINGTTYQVGTTFTGLAPGSYTVLAQDMSTSCVSGGTVLVVNAVPTAPAAPTASVTTQPTCTTPTGTIAITAPLGATLQYSVNGTTYQAGTTFTGLAPGNYNVTVQNTTTGCTSAATNLTVNAVPGAAAAPTASVTAQPTCTTPTGTILVTAPLGATLQYSVNGTTYQAGTTFTGLIPGNYSVTVQNTTTGCTSAATNLTVNAVPSAPAAPTASVTAQPSCTTPTGTILVTAPLGATLQYSVNGTTYQAGTTFTGLIPGNYNVTVQNTTTGCTSAATNLTVNAVPGAPAAPTASVTTQPTCTTPTGTITITAPLGATLQYSVNGTTYQAGTTFTGLAPGNYNVTVQNTTTGCTSAPTNLTVNAVPSAPAAPAASVTAQPDCTTPTGTILVTAPLGVTLQYSVNGTTYQAGTTFTGLAPGNYSVTVQNTTTGCTSTATNLNVNAVPGAPAAPTASVTTQPNCTTPTGTIEVTAPLGATLQYSVNGTTYQAGTTFTGLAPGNYNVTVQNTTTGCTSAATNLTVNAIPTAPASPTFQFTTVIDCDHSTASIEILSPIGNNYAFYLEGVAVPIGQYALDNLQPSTTYDLTVVDLLTTCVSGATLVVTGALPPATDCEPVECGDLFVPTAFSPNADNNNESFGIKVNADCVEEMTLRVFDRWGELIFVSTDPATKWDGTYRDEPLNAGVFVYTLEIKLSNETDVQNLSGNVTLFN